MPKTFHCPKCDKDFTLSDEELESHEFADKMVGMMDQMAGIDQRMSFSGHMTCPNCKEYVKPTEVSGGCFIATAACGTDQAEDVVRLREFREHVLRPSRLGGLLIATYEFCSPPLARLIARSPWSRFLVRHLLVAPLRRLVGRIPTAKGRESLP